jgi:peptidoglycan/LPS O-acetylase OafA/YrhL
VRLKQLDALRAIAVLLVMGRHLTWNPVWFRVGWTGVDLFFVLSGFLVSGLLFREYKASGQIRVLRFLGRRAFKIYPAYYFLLILTVTIHLGFGLPLKWRLTWPDFIFVQSYRLGLWGHLWSLAVE